MIASAALCTRNRYQEILHCLERLVCQTRPVEQVIIVDASDDENLMSIVRALFQDRFGECLLTRSVPGHMGQWNVGIRLSRGKIVFFFDDDVLLDADYIKAMMKVFERDAPYHYGRWMGKITDLLPPKGLDSVLQRWFFLTQSFGSGRFKALGFLNFPHGPDLFMEVETLSGCGMAFRREVLDYFNFDETLSGYSYMEDSDYAYRVSKYHRLSYEPKARLRDVVSPRERFSSRLTQQMLARNHRCLFQKNFTQRARHRLAHFLSLIGLFLHPLLLRDLAGTWGALEDLLSFRRRAS